MGPGRFCCGCLAYIRAVGAGLGNGLNSTQMSTDGSKFLVFAGETLAGLKVEEGPSSPCTPGRETSPLSYFCQDGGLGVCFEMNCGLKEGHEADLAPHQECSLRAVDFSRARENHFCVPGKAHSQPLLFWSGLSSALPHWCPQCQGLMDVCKPMMPPSHISSSSLLCCHPSAWILPTRQEEKQRDKRDVIPQSTAQNQSGDRRRAQGDGCSPEKPGTLQERATQINHCKRDTELEFNCCAVPCPLAKSRFTPKGLTVLCSAKSNNDNCCFLWNMK